MKLQVLNKLRRINLENNNFHRSAIVVYIDVKRNTNVDYKQCQHTSYPSFFKNISSNGGS